MNYFEMEPMKYWAMSSSMTKETRQSHLEKMITSGEYIYSRKYDGNWSRAVITPERQALQTRGISKVTGTYGEIQDKVFFWDALCSAFTKDTVILGEVYLEGGIDKDVGSMTRSLTHKAKSIQDEEYYHNISKTPRGTKII
jgi:ATP-dependent DNA ligase